MPHLPLLAVRLPPLCPGSMLMAVCCLWRAVRRCLTSRARYAAQKAWCCHQCLQHEQDRSFVWQWLQLYCGGAKCKLHVDNTHQHLCQQPCSQQLQLHCLLPSAGMGRILLGRCDVSITQQWLVVACARNWHCVITLLENQSLEGPVLRCVSSCCWSAACM